MKQEHIFGGEGNVMGIAHMPADELSEIASHQRYAEGRTVEQVCNENYRYLNEAGVSLQEFADVIDAVVKVCTTPDEAAVMVTRTDGRRESFQKITTRDAEPPEYQFRLGRDLPQGVPDEMSMPGGFSGKEGYYMKRGVFEDPRPGEVGATRAEQILTRLNYTQTGGRILAEHVVAEQDKPKIDLVEEPVVQEPEKVQPVETAEAVGSLSVRTEVQLEYPQVAAKRRRWLGLFSDRDRT